MTGSVRDATLDGWRDLRIERAGESFRVDGVALAEVAGSPGVGAEAAAAAAERGFPVAVLAATPEGAAAMLEKIKDCRPLLAPQAGKDADAYRRLAAKLGCALVVSGDRSGRPDSCSAGCLAGRCRRYPAGAPGR